MIGRRARPEDAHLPVDSLPRDAGVVGHAAPGGDAELFEDVVRRLVVELLAGAEPRREVADDPPVLAGAGRRLDGPSMVNDASLDVGRRALVFLHQGTWKDDIRVTRGLGHEEVDHREELESAERLANEITVRQ